MSESQSSLEDELRQEDEEYRYAYAEDFLNTSVATQIRVIREQRGLTQEDLAQKIGTKQAGISRLENVNYSAWKTETLRKIARALKVRLKITFETFGSLVDEADVFSRKNLERPTFEDDPRFHEGVAASADPVSMKPSLVVTYGSANHHWQDDHPLKLPTPGESFALIFPRSHPFVVRDDTRNQSPSTPKLLREVS
jgi:transcriptional regulator with XRE-family HTH domain